MSSASYEHLLALYSDRQALIALLREFRPYLELLPSLRRPNESVISIPLPLVRLRETVLVSSQNAGRFSAGDLVHLPCDIGVIMCDPEWQIKTGSEIFIFIHRPQEEFSALLRRWRQAQIWTDRGYDWAMPTRYQHIFSEGTRLAYPLFVLTEETPEQVRKGLVGADLPFVEDSARALGSIEPGADLTVGDLPHTSGEPTASDEADFTFESDA